MSKTISTRYKISNAWKSLKGVYTKFYMMFKRDISGHIICKNKYIKIYKIFTWCLKRHLWSYKVKNEKLKWLKWKKRIPDVRQKRHANYVKLKLKIKLKKKILHDLQKRHLWSYKYNNKKYKIFLCLAQRKSLII